MGEWMYLASQLVIGVKGRGSFDFVFFLFAFGGGKANLFADLAL